MTTKNAMKLEAGDRVRFSDGVFGTVTTIKSGWFEVKWDDGQYGAIAYHDASDIDEIGILTGWEEV